MGFILAFFKTAAKIGIGRVKEKRLGFGIICSKKK